MGLNALDYLPDDKKLLAELRLRIRPRRNAKTQQALRLLTNRPKLTCNSLGASCYRIVVCKTSKLCKLRWIGVATYPAASACLSLRIASRRAVDFELYSLGTQSSIDAGAIVLPGVREFHHGTALLQVYP